jgi:hypothetical protein
MGSSADLAWVVHRQFYSAPNSVAGEHQLGFRMQREPQRFLDELSALAAADERLIRHLDAIFALKQREPLSPVRSQPGFPGDGEPAPGRAKGAVLHSVGDQLMQGERDRLHLMAR